MGRTKNMKFEEDCHFFSIKTFKLSFLRNQPNQTKPMFVKVTISGHGENREASSRTIFGWSERIGVDSGTAKELWKWRWSERARGSRAKTLVHADEANRRERGWPPLRSIEIAKRRSSHSQWLCSHSFELCCCSSSSLALCCCLCLFEINKATHTRHWPLVFGKDLVSDCVTTHNSTCFWYIQYCIGLDLYYIFMYVCICID